MILAQPIHGLMLIPSSDPRFAFYHFLRHNLLPSLRLLLQGLVYFRVISTITSAVALM